MVAGARPADTGGDFVKRPGPAGLLILLAFAIVFAVELNTLLSMFGLDVASRVYFPVVAVVIAVVFGALFCLPEKETKRATST